MIVRYKALDGRNYGKDNSSSSKERKISYLGRRDTSSLSTKRSTKEKKMSQELKIISGP